MLAKFLAALKLIPSDVDGAVAGLNKSLSNLEAVAAAKLAEHDKHKDIAHTALNAADAAYDEASRAGRIHAAISALIA